MTFHEKFARPKDDFRRISFALLLHDTVNGEPEQWPTESLPRHASPGSRLAYLIAEQPE